MIEPPVDPAPGPKAYEGFVLAWFHSGSPTEGTTHPAYRGKTALLSPDSVLETPQAALRAIVALLRDGFRIVIGRKRG